MKVFLSAIAMVALLGFVGTVGAKEHKPLAGHFVKIEGKELVFIGGTKAKGKEHRIAFDDSTKFSIDGKDSTATDFAKNVKADEYLEISEVTPDKKDKDKKLATAVAAFAVPPAPAAPVEKK